MVGLLGKKIGMTHRFDAEGRFIPVTVLEAGPCFVIQKNKGSLQLGYDEDRKKRISQAVLGIFKKNNIPPCSFIKEVELSDPEKYKVGDILKVDIFKEGEFVDVTGISIGKGFQGGMKRWHWGGGPRSHGSTSHRRVGSIGASSDPSRVFKGQHMPGHMGNRKVTIQNLKVVMVDSSNNLLLVKGAVSGHKNSYVIIKKSKKKKAISPNEKEANQK
jgi:large subunit ribosomal protein L3